MRDNTKKMFQKEITRLEKRKEKLKGELEIGKRCGDKLHEAGEDEEEVILMFKKLTAGDTEMENIKTITHQIIKLYKENRYDELNHYLITVGGIVR